MQSTLILIRGIPGSGKSYIADALADSLGRENVVILDPDKIDLKGDAFRAYSNQLTADGIEEKFHPFRFLRQTGYDGISAGKTVIWNQAFNDFAGFEITVKRMQEFAEANDVALKVLVVEVETSPDVARSRIASRAAAGGHDVPEDKFDAFMSGYESFAGRGYDTVAVDGGEEVSRSIATVRERLND